MTEIDDIDKQLIRDYFSGDPDEQELKLYKEGDAKKLYKYGVENEKVWAGFPFFSEAADEDPDMEDIEDAIETARGFGDISSID